MEDFKNASGENSFLDLMNCPKQGLILPHSNANEFGDESDVGLPTLCLTIPGHLNA